MTLSLITPRTYKLIGLYVWKACYTPSETISDRSLTFTFALVYMKASTIHSYRMGPTNSFWPRKLLKIIKNANNFLPIDHKNIGLPGVKLPSLVNENGEYVKGQSLPKIFLLILFIPLMFFWYQKTFFSWT